MKENRYKRKVSLAPKICRKCWGNPCEDVPFEEGNWTPVQGTDGRCTFHWVPGEKITVVGPAIKAECGLIGMTASAIG